MTVDQSNGNLYFVYYDRRNYDISTDSTDVYLGYSNDGGATIQNVQINEDGFVPDPTVFFGDYISVSAVNGRVRPIWMAYGNGTLSVWTALIDGADLGLNGKIMNQASSIGLCQNSPNPFSQNTWIKFNLKNASKIDLDVFDILGNKVAILYENEQFKSGDYDYIFNASSYHLKPGIYYYTLSSDEYQITKKMIVN
jgi:hypothetical protein